MSFFNRLSGAEKIFQLTQQLNEYRQSPKENNYKLIKAEVDEDLGKYVKDWCYPGILVGAVLDEDDFYYLIMDKDRKIHYSSCVGKYKLMNEEDWDNDLSVLDWMKKNDEKSLIKLIEDSIKRNEVLPITRYGVNKK